MYHHRSTAAAAFAFQAASMPFRGWQAHQHTVLLESDEPAGSHTVTQHAAARCSAPALPSYREADQTRKPA